MSERSGISWPSLATGAAAFVATLLVILKAAAWIETGSVAMLGSLADSLLDLLASLIAFLGVRIAAQPPDENHRFGHAKAEAISSLVQLVMITGSAVFVLVESIRALIDPAPLAHANLAIQVMVASIGATLLLVAFQTFALSRSTSLATESDRAHYLGDFIANAGILLAVILTGRFGILWADGVAGVLAAGFLFWSVISIARRALPQLMDEEVSAAERAKILRIITADPEVAGVHAVRTRKAGPTTYIQGHLELDPHLTLKHAQEIADRVDLKLREEVPGADVILKQDLHGQTPEHDAFGQISD
ncbi:cation efflux family protein [Parvularcula bermudensis HTCC2503]|uniref:Cation efflux family protein n=1 Tax=Parvularcula bermudensis (strain ATCC BAA-594 / HTCC2503 / KCTC 12087) TaxID=314260 RepID=E0TG78_PARBH|nr:cation diffusion facilitator family transporter [Parvularcula bermudensis]ADM10649.1 cation efflux family protein [Parvularcula bermudensis HTCC2503]